MPGLLQNVNALLGGVMGGIGGGGQSEPEPQGYPATLVGYDGDDFTDSTVGTTGVPKEHAAIACPAGVYTEIWSYTVKAQQAVVVGYGNPNQPYNQGRLFFDAKSNHATAPVRYEGMVRIWQARGRRTQWVSIWEGRTENLHPSTEDITTMIHLPNQATEAGKPIVGEDSLVVITFMPDQTFTLGWGAEITDAGGDCTKLRLPTTIFE